MCNRWWITLSVLCISTRKNVKSPEIQFLQFSFHINLLPCYASHCLKQVHSLAAFEVIIFCLTIVACDVSVCFFNACYFGFGQVFVCTHEEWTFHTPFRFSTRTSMFQHSHNSMLCSRSTLPQHSIWTYSNQSAQRLQMAKAWKRRCLAWFWNDNNHSLQSNQSQMKCDVWKTWWPLLTRRTSIFDLKIFWAVCLCKQSSAVFLTNHPLLNLEDLS